MFSLQIPNKSTLDCVQLYYFWKKLCINYKSLHLKSTCPSHYETITNNNNNQQQDDSSINNNNNTNNNSSTNTLEFFDLVSNTDPDDTDSEIGLNQTHHHHHLHHHQHHHNNNSEIRSHICEMPDCSAVKQSLYHIHLKWV